MKERNQRLINRLSQMVGYKNPDIFKGVVTEWTRVINYLSLESTGFVTEFGPGVSPKLQFALDEIDFKGNLVLIDLDSKALWGQNYVFDLLHPKFSLQLKTEDLFVADLAGNSLIIGNHLLDDLVADDFAKHEGIDYQEVFTDPNLQEIFWERVCQNPDLAFKTVLRLAEKLEDVDKGCFIVFNNYLANFDLKYKVQNRTTFINALLKDLGLLLNRKRFTNVPFNFDNSGKEWLVMKKV